MMIPPKVLYTLILSLSVAVFAQRPVEIVPPADGRVALHGALNCICFDPSDSLRMWVGAATGGVWYTTDGGAHWSSYGSDTLTLVGVSDMCLLPGSHDTLICANGDNQDSLSYLSYTQRTNPPTLNMSIHSDSSARWTYPKNNYPWGFSIPFPSLFYRVLAPQSKGNDLLALSNAFGCKMRNFKELSSISVSNGFSQYYSSWNLKNRLARKVNNDAIVYICTIGHLYRSTDTAKTCTLVDSLSSFTFSNSEIATTPANSSTVYVCGSNESGAFLGLFRSTDDGLHWEKRSSAPNIFSPYTDAKSSTGTASKSLSLAVSPTNADILYAGSSNIWRSSDGGKNWTCVSSPDPKAANYVVPRIRRLAFSSARPDWIFACTENGLYRSSDNGATWKSLSEGIHAMNIRHLAHSAFSDSIVYCATSVGTFRYDGARWTKIHDSSAIQIQCDITHPERVRIVTASGFRLESNDSAKTFGFSPVPGNVRIGADMHPYYSSVSMPGVEFANLSSLYFSRNGGQSWQPVNVPSSKKLMTLSLSESGDSLLYALDADGAVWQSSNFGSDWTARSHQPMSSPVLAIAAHPKNKASLALLSEDGVQYKSALTYLSDILFNFPGGTPSGLSANCFFWKTDDCSSELCIGTTRRILNVTMSDNGLASIHSVDTIPNCGVNALSLRGQTLYVGTNGRGLWKNSYNGVSPRVAMECSASELCPGETLTLHNKSEFSSSCTWTISNAIPEVSNSDQVEVQLLGAGPHTIQLTAHGCGNKSISQVVNVLPNQRAHLSIGSADVCIGDTVIIRDRSGMSFEKRSLLSSSGRALSFIGDSALYVCDSVGAVKMQLFRSNRCSQDSSIDGFSVHEVPADVHIIARDDSIACSQASYTKYRWLLNGKAIDGASSASFYPKVSGRYSVVVWNAAGCSTVSESVLVDRASAVYETIGAALFLHPNPASNFIDVELPYVAGMRDKAQLELRNVLGQLVQRFDCSSSQQSVHLPISEFPAGCYTISFVYASERYTARFVKH